MRAISRAVAAGAIAALAAVTAQAASAGELTLRWIKPDGAVIGEKALSTADLEELPQTTFTTNTPWTTATTKFQGPAIAELAALGPAASMAEVTAINDYSAQMPPEDWNVHGAVLAVRVNDELMRVRDKGPFWVMYPIDQDPRRLDIQLFHSRMVWQVQNIDFVVE